MNKIFLLVCWCIITGTALAAGAELALPHGVFSHMDGEWSVELISPCQSTAVGRAYFNKKEGSALISWNGNALENTTLFGVLGDDTLTLDALGSRLVAGGGKVFARVCDTQSNELSTPNRPGVASKVVSTYITEYSGVLGKKTVQCGDDTPRPFHLHTLEVPTGAKGELEGQYVELLLDSSVLEKSCVLSSQPDSGEKKRRRKKHTAVTTDGPEKEEARVTKLTTLRLIRQKPAPKSFFQQFYPSLLLIGVFIAFRVAQGYFSFGAK